MGSRNCNCFHINSYSSSGTDVNLSQVSLRGPLHPDSQCCLASVVMLSHGVQGRTGWVWALSCSSRDLGSVGIFWHLCEDYGSQAIKPVFQRSTSSSTQIARLVRIDQDRPGLGQDRGKSEGRFWKARTWCKHGQERWGVTKGTGAASNGATKDWWEGVERRAEKPQRFMNPSPVPCGSKIWITYAHNLWKL